MVQSTELATTTISAPSYAALATIIRDDCTYDLLSHLCPNCSATHYTIGRMAGAFPSIYRVPPEFEPSMFEAFVDDIHGTMAIAAWEVIENYRLRLSEVNSPHGIECNGGYYSVLQDYARQRIIQLRDSGLLARLERGSGSSATDRAVRAAFELGFALSELRMKEDYEEALFEGWRLMEGREVGQEAAARAKRQQTKLTREAIAKASREACEADPTLLRNDTALARHIEGRKLDALIRSDGRSIGFEAIVKHLRQIRREDKPEKV